MMTIIATFVFLCAGLTGLHSAFRVSHVAMKTGRTVLIPCHYEADYIDHVKYLCRGSVWNSCKYKIRSDKGNSAKYSINDDKSQRIVTFAITKLELSDSDDYWCCIEIYLNGDVGTRFKLTVTAEAEPKLSVDSQGISGYYDGQVTVNFKCGGSGKKKWCRVDGTCLKENGKMNGAEVSIDKNDEGFSITMSGLKAQNIGWYWFALDDLQMPVVLQLSKRPKTTTIATTKTESTTAFDSQMQHSLPTYITAALIALGFLIVIVIVSLVVWFTLKRNKKKIEAESSPENDCSPKDNEVLYSDVTFINNQASNKAAIQEEDVVYSTLGQH